MILIIAHYNLPVMLFDNNIIHFVRVFAPYGLALQLEIVALRHQLDVQERSRPSRFRIEPGGGRPVRATKPCNVVEFPAVHGLHHFYLPKAA